MPNSSSRDAIDLICLLCTYNPDLRITAHRALKHKYFNLLRETSRENLNTEGSTRIAIQATNMLPVQQVEPALNIQEIQEVYKPLYKKNPTVSV